MTLLHVTTQAGWAQLIREGTRPTTSFWHLCTAGQLPFVLAQHFAGQSGLVILHLDPAQLGDVRWEASEPGMDPFPHLYAALPAAAVMALTLTP